MAAGHSGCDGTMNTINNYGAGLKRDGAFLSASALLFIASAATTIYSCRSMSGGMAMPGGSYPGANVPEVPESDL